MVEIVELLEIPFTNKISREAVEGKTLETVFCTAREPNAKLVRAVGTLAKSIRFEAIFSCASFVTFPKPTSVAVRELTNANEPKEGWLVSEVNES